MLHNLRQQRYVRLICALSLQRSGTHRLVTSDTTNFRSVLSNAIDILNTESFFRAGKFKPFRGKILNRNIALLLSSNNTVEELDKVGSYVVLKRPEATAHQNRGAAKFDTMYVESRRERTIVCRRTGMARQSGSTSWKQMSSRAWEGSIRGA